MLAILVAAAGVSCDQRNPAEQSVTRPAAMFRLEVDLDAAEQGNVEVILHSKDTWADLAEPGQEIDWPGLLTLSLSKGDELRGKEAVPVLGTYAVEPRVVRYRPVYPLLKGRDYVARFDGAVVPGIKKMDPIEVEISIPLAEAGKPVLPSLAELHPSVPMLPANHLKFYLLFSEPMQRGRVFEFLKLLREDGSEVPDPFRDTELWSEDGKRFTLWFHPGRQKDGVNLNVDFGPVLEEGQSYRLVISGKWKAERGLAIGEDVEYRFEAGPQDRELVDVNGWKLEGPKKKGTRERVKLFFPEPLDWALLKSKLTVQTVDGRGVEGVVEMGVQELAWFFLPDRKWEPGGYRVAVETILEDLAGNSVARLFEVDLEKTGGKDVEGPKVVYREFTVE